mmetsp:Transcript_13065/g.29074  ORF Transcript_13065/g.29074 Transcript_13065/m.29074 type:complete len:577 (-) Transcript_13065:283-2013(-)|eukprot:CAMPEP_0206539792 /NCGR_PEP_ID=MMETSP0325_2-20121206/8624_1 /ASSEMBLY_ACC=CAM_ASM_000347 /TAXON_ID=2866 /ORGANISM="Crypthecodinium cohnii, Strain Seligo" /LENGTH=576 /DNA_ID=CAMNT_0054037399 /DNA_START=83 /DNA_END=1814 /DNA_ORIENTATION=+
MALRMFATVGALLACGHQLVEAATCDAENGECHHGNTNSNSNSRTTDSVLIQKFPATLARASALAATSTQVAAASHSHEAAARGRNSLKSEDAMENLTHSVAVMLEEMLEMKVMLAQVQEAINSKTGCCCTSDPDGPSSSITQDSSSGLCAVFGDPHFTTFDGAHTIILRHMTMWLVKSENIWIQALSVNATGNFAGIIVGGPFMNNHTLALYNATLVGEEVGSLVAEFDGTRILEDEVSEFEEPFLMWAARRVEWNTSLHDNSILDINPIINWTVGSWEDRFSNAPRSGLYLFRFPNGVELTATGVDYMSSVIKMEPATGGQSGYCGNFNGVAEDEFEPPADGVVPPILIPVWNTPVGENLGDVSDEENMFKLSVTGLSLLSLAEATRSSKSAQGPAPAEVPSACLDPVILAKAEEACQHIPGLTHRADCIADYCISGNDAVADDMGAAEVLEERFNTHGVIRFVGFGRCLDGMGNLPRALKSEKIRDGQGCQQLLKRMSNVQGVLGSQLKVEGTCELVLRRDADESNVLAELAPYGQNWEPTSLLAMPADVRSEADDLVGGVEKDLSWSCWKLN